MPRRDADGWRALTIKPTAGAELWVVVGSGPHKFRMPAYDPVEKLLWGLVDGWDMSQEKGRGPKDPLHPDQRTLLKLWAVKFGR